MPLKSIDISLNINFLFILISILLISFYSYLFYKTTIPKVTQITKFVLILLRSLALFFIIILIFEPIIKLTYKKITEPNIYFFIDNSKSIAEKDSSKRLNQIISLINKLESINKNLKIFTFGSKPKLITTDSLNKIKLDEPITNFEKVISHLNNSDNIAAALILSDGIITDGPNPVYYASKFNFPIFTVGIGDTTTYKDVQIKDVIYNQITYTNKQTEIEAIILNTGFFNKSAGVSLFEENNLIQTKNIILSETGLNKIKFDYTPKKEGEVKLKISISQFNGESNFSNNEKSFYLNVLKNKINVVLIAGCPSADLSSISRALAENENIILSKFIQITENKFFDNLKISKIDSADVIVFIDFPSTNTPTNIAEQIFSKIEKNKKNFFYLISSCTDLSKLKKFEKFLPFTINKTSTNLFQISPSIVENSIKLIYPKSLESSEWLNLPPLTINASEFVPKPGSTVILRGTVRNVSDNFPLIIISNIANQKTFAILAGDIWKWQLLTAEKKPYFFANFINNAIQWLNLSEKQNQFIINTTKKVYFRGEPIEFYAELYDNTLSPIDSADIKLTVFSKNEKHQLKLEKIRSGLFYGKIELNAPDNYFYEGDANLDGLKIKSNLGRFSISNTEVELLNTKMDENLLRQLASVTNGDYYSVDKAEELKNKLTDIINKYSKEKIFTSEIDLRTENWAVVIIIALLTIEWLIRRRSGMI